MSAELACRPPDNWANLPDHIVQYIFHLLPPRNRYYASMVCSKWYHNFYTTGAWRTFVYKNRVFTRPKFTIVGGIQYHTDHYRLRQLCTYTAAYWANLVVQPIEELYNLHEFLRVLYNFSEYYRNQNEFPLRRIRCFEFNWQLKCKETRKSAPIAYGTGGQFLKSINQFISNLIGLEKLALRQLLLDRNESEAFLGDLLNYFGNTLKELRIINLTKLQHTFLHLGLFLNLQKLVVSPQHINDDVIILLGNHQCIEDIVLVQDESSKGAIAVSSKAWRELRKTGPHIEVYLVCKGLCKEDILWQPEAPVVSIVYSNPSALLTNENALRIVENGYISTLRCYIQKGLQRKYRSKSFDDRCDTALIMLIRNCTRLEILAIRDRISTATVLLLAHNINQQTMQKQNDYSLKLYVRRNAILKRSDWPCAAEWSKNFYRWLCHNARDYDLAEGEISQLFGNLQWKFLSDNEYMHKLK